MNETPVVKKDDMETLQWKSYPSSAVTQFTKGCNLKKEGNLGSENKLLVLFFQRIINITMSRWFRIIGYLNQCLLIMKGKEKKNKIDKRSFPYIPMYKTTSCIVQPLIFCINFNASRKNEFSVTENTWFLKSKRKITCVARDSLNLLKILNIKTRSILKYMKCEELKQTSYYVVHKTYNFTKDSYMENNISEHQRIYQC